MPFMKQCINVVIGVNYTVLIDWNSLPCKTHCRKTIVLSHNNISRPHHIHKSKVNAIVPFGNGYCFCAGFFKNMRSVANDDTTNFVLSSHLYSYINNRTSIRINQYGHALAPLDDL